MFDTEIDEVERLRRTNRDLAACLALPALWGGREPPYILSTLLDVLVSTLELDFACAMIRDARSQVALLQECRPRSMAPPPWIDLALEQPPAGDDAAGGPTVHLPGVGEVQLARAPFLVQSGNGLVLAASVRGDFPSERDTSLLRAAVTQAAIALNNAHLVATLRRLQTVTEAALSPQTLDELLQHLVARVRAALESDTATLLLLDQEGTSLVPVASDGLQEAVREDVRIALGTSVAGRIAASEEGLILDDLSTTEVGNPVLHGRVRSLVGAPLRVGERVIGVIHVGAVTPRRFTEADLGLLQLVAQRAALAVERALLDEAERKARAEADRQRREAEVIAELARAINASLDLGTILTRVTEAARELLCTDLAAIALRDPATATMIVRHQAGSRLSPDEPIRVEPGRGVGGHVLISGDPFRSADVLSDPRLSLRRPEYFRAEGIVAMLVVPMRIDGRIEGLLYASHRSRRLFTDHDEAMLSRLADQVAVAIRNRHLFSAEQAARAAAEAAERRASFLAEASQMLSASPDWETTLASLARFAVPRMADLCAVDLVEEHGRVRRLAVAHVDPAKEKLARELRERYHFEPDAPVGVPTVLRTGQSEFLPEISESLLESRARDVEQLRLFRAIGVGSAIVTPIVARGRVLGAITLVHGESGRRYDAADLALAEDLARRAGLAADNARLYRETEAAEQRLRLALDAGRMGTWEWTIATGEVRWSSSLEAIHGYAPGTFPGTFEALRKEIHPDDREQVLRAIAEAVEERREHRIEYRIVRPDGAVRWVEGRGQLFCDAGGRPEGMVGVCADITERKQTEEKFRLAVEAAPNAMIMIDQQGVIRLANALAEPLFGYARDDLLGQSIERLVPLRFRDQHPGHRGGFAADPRRRPMGAGRDLYALRKDGTEVLVEIGLSPIETADGVFVLAAITDITERKQAEQRQAAQHAVSRVLAEASTLEDAAPQILQAVCESLGWDVGELWTVDREATVLRCVDVWHRPSTEAIELEAITRGRTFAPGAGLLGRIWASGEPAWIPDVLEDDRFPRTPVAAREGLHGAFGFPIRLGDDALGVIEFFSHEVREPDRELLAMMASIGSQIGQFIERRRAEEERARLLVREQAARQEAEEANRTKDEFLAMLSHELRTPLNAMLGWTRMLRSGTLDQAAVERALEVIERNTKVQTQLIEDLLDVSRIVSGKLHLDLRPVDLVPVVRAAIEAVQSAAEAREIRLEAAFRPAGPVTGDPGRLQQIAWNLLSNAIKFTPEGGRVEVRLERVGSLVLITVTDTGKGISPEFLPHVFDRFRQAPGRRPHGGLGLGLAIVRHIVELHGGTVEAASAGEGQGATFTVKLPVRPARIETRDAAAVPPAVTREVLGHLEALRGVRVLVVDDDADTRELIAAVLGQQGADVRVSPSAREAVETLRSWRPDVLVSDIEMPDENGYELIRRVRALGREGGGRIPAVALTAYAQTADRSRALLEGFQLHVVKPVEPAEIAAAVASLAGRIQNS